MKRKLFRLLILVICFAVCFSVCGCGEESDSTDTSEADATNSSNGNGTDTVNGTAEVDTGLEFSLSSDETCYTVVGIGTYSDKDLIIPETHNEKPVTKVGEYSFCGEPITSVTIPSTVHSIGESAFSGCKELVEVSIADGVKSIGNKAFDNCINLKCVDMGENVAELGHSIFNRCVSLCDISLSDSIEIISGSCFAYCRSITEIELPNNLTAISSNAFKECRSLTRITVPEKVTSIEDKAFELCTNLSEVCNNSQLQLKITTQDHGSITQWAQILTNADGSQQSGFYKGFKYFDTDDGLFRFSKVDGGEYILEAYLGTDGNVVLPTDINGQKYTEIEELGGYVKSIVLPEGTTVIDGNAFYNCELLEQITVPKSVVLIEDYAFYNTSGCTVQYEGTMDEWNKIEKERFWKDGFANSSIVCSDGTVEQSGNAALS